MTAVRALRGRRLREHPELPLDPDAARVGVVSRPVHVPPRLVLLVFAGGVLGTPARYGLQLWLPTRTGRWPAGTFTLNLLGALLLGALLEGLVRRGEDAGGRRLLRLAVGTGFLGAFTTYSSLALETDLLVRAHHPALAAGYVLASVAGGIVLCGLGVYLAALHHTRRSGRDADT